MDFSCIIFCLVASGMIWKEAEAVQCYSCTGCNDPFKESQASVVTCPTSCLKTKAEVSSIQTVIRGCGTLTSNSCSQQSIAGIDTAVCTCTTDKCNGAESNSAQMFTFVVMVAFLVAVRNRFF